MGHFWYWLFLIGGWIVFLAWGHACVRIIHFYLTNAGFDSPDSRFGGETDVPVRVLVPACNEEESIEACLRSLVEQDYDNLEIVAINDRSSDATGAVMERVARSSDRLKVVHIEELPGGWLGKNHANWVGTRSGDPERARYFLFTDGDVIFDSDCIRLAMAHVAEHRIDHLCLFPRMIPGGFWEGAMCSFFIICYLIKCKSWHLRNFRKQDSFTGVGAFNLVERRAYDSVGGHQTLRLEVADDYKLGKLIKQNKHHCAALFSDGKIRVRWQVGLRGVIRGLEKNSASGFDYSIFHAVWQMGMFVLATISPLMAAYFCTGLACSGWVGTVILQVGILAWFGSVGGSTMSVGVTFPICSLCFVYAVLRSFVLLHLRGGIRWRGTFYRLQELLRGVV